MIAGCGMRVEIPELDPQSAIRNPQSAIRNQQPAINKSTRNQQPAINNPTAVS